MLRWFLLCLPLLGDCLRVEELGPLSAFKEVVLELFFAVVQVAHELLAAGTGPQQHHLLRLLFALLLHY